MNRILTIFLVAIENLSFAQRIDLYSTLHEINDSNFVRISYDNDLFQGQDRYYTQGFSVELLNSVFRQNPLNKILVADTRSQIQKYGFHIESTVFTPSRINSDSILLNDRPYSAILSLGMLRMSYNSALKHKICSELIIGVIGPAALGQEIQTGIHHLTNNTIPKGWQHQIRNDLIVDYRLRFEKQLFFLNHIFGTSAMGETKLGTYQNNISLGLNMHLGWKQNPSLSSKKFQLYLYGQSSVRFVAYDAGLLGGMINRTTNYTLLYKDLNPIVLENHIGTVFSISSFYFGIDFGFITSEFSGSTQHGWGGVRLGFNSIQ